MVGLVLSPARRTLTRRVWLPTDELLANVVWCGRSPGTMSWSKLLVGTSFALTLALGAACSDPVEADDDGTSSSSSSGSSGVSSSSGGSSSGRISSSSGGSSGVTDPTYAEAPQLQAIEPNRATVGSAGPTLVVRGRNFVPRTVVQLDGAALETSFIDATELRATIPTDKLASPGALIVTVGTSPPGGGASQALEFTVENPVPTLTHILSPESSSVLMGSPAFTLQLEGSGFVAGAKVRWAGEELATTVQSLTTVRAEVPAAKLTQSGGFEIDVLNPAPGGGASAKLVFVVTNPTVQLTSMDPSQALVGANEVVLNFVGNGFVSGKSRVMFGGTPLVPTVTSATAMSATVPANKFTTVGSVTVYVENPNPGGGISNPILFDVVNPAPRVTSLSPSAVTAGAGATTVKINGSNFVSSSKVTIRGDVSQELAVNANTRTETELTVIVPQSLLATGGRSYDIRVETPSPGGGSAQLPFNVRNAGAVIDDVFATDSDKDGFLIGAPVDIEIAGSGFLGSSTVTVDGASVAAGTVVVHNASRITARITPSQANVQIKVTAPSAADSNVVQRTACSPLGGTTWSLPVLGSYYGASGDLFSSAPTSKLFAGSTGKTCPAQITFRDNLQPYAALVVQNTSGVAAKLEAWAQCSGQFDDAYLALYNTSTVPTTDAARKSCTGVLSNGKGGSNAKWFSLENSGNSNYCPGFWSKDAQGVDHGAPTIAACGTWVVYLQPDTISNVTHTRPQGVTVGLWPQ